MRLTQRLPYSAGPTTTEARRSQITRRPLARPQPPRPRRHMAEEKTFVGAVPADWAAQVKV